jgi:galactonate dehydratase
MTDTVEAPQDPRAQGRSGLKVTSVDSFLVSPQWLFVRVRTNEGITGWGEGGVQMWARAVQGAVTHLAQYLVGQDPLTIEAHWQVMRKSGFYRDGTILSSALAALDEALWDIAGKFHGVPVHELLGGPVRDRVRAYAWIAGDDFGEFTEEELIAETQGRIDQGFSAFKLTPAKSFAIDTPQAGHELVSRIAALRDAVGPTRDIALDVHGHWSKAMARRLLPQLEPYELLFVEEPLLPEHLHMLREITAATSLPIATGERLYNRWDFRVALESGLAVAQPDVSQAGGISETRRIAAMAEAYDVVVAPHCPLGPIALAASLQIDFATPNILIQEQSVSHFGDQFLDYLVDRSVFDIIDGYFARPTAPGLGIEVDERAVEEAAKVGHNRRNPLWRHTDGSYAEF